MLHLYNNVPSVPSLLAQQEIPVTARRQTKDGGTGGQNTHRQARAGGPDNQSSTQRHTTQEEGTVNHFAYIRSLCETNASQGDIDLSPQAFQAHRQVHWPTMTPQAPNEIINIYEAVRRSGIPNAMGCRIPVPSGLNIQAWRHALGNEGEMAQLCDFLEFGFPLGYMGPTSNTLGISNHPTARQFPSQVHEFVQKEKGLGALLGPFSEPPFREWAHVSPLMSRPKADPAQRRVITDLTFPRENSVNAYIRKNTIVGEERTHSLPTVDAVVDRVLSLGTGSFIFTVDVSRAYKNFDLGPSFLIIEFRK